MFRLTLMEKLTEAQERQKHLYKSVLGVNIDAIATEVMAAHNFEKAANSAECVENLAPLMALTSGLKTGPCLMIRSDAITLGIRKLGKE